MSCNSNNNNNHHHHHTTFDQVTYAQIQAAGPPSPPLGFSRWTVTSAQILRGPTGQSHSSSSSSPIQVLVRTNSGDRNYNNNNNHTTNETTGHPETRDNNGTSHPGSLWRLSLPSNAAYLLPGKQIKETLCGKVVQAQVVVPSAEHDTTINGTTILVSTATTTTNNNNINNNVSRYFQKTHQWVAIKMDRRSNMRHLHHGTQAPSENPWKEVAALEMLGNATRSTNTRQRGKFSDNEGHVKNNTDNDDKRDDEEEYEPQMHDEDHHVVSLLDALVDDSYLYEMLPYYGGGSLHDVIRLHESPRGRFNEARARHYFLQLLQAIHFLHSHGVCHRDISTHNLMVDKEHGDQLYLIDFGMCLRIPYSYPDDDTTEDVTDISAGTIRRLIRTQHHCGKLRFMAPEMYQGKDFDALAVDLWSAAVVLFVMLTGRPPYGKPEIRSDAGFYDLMDAHFYWDAEKVPQAFSWGCTVSNDAIDLLHRMFQYNPQDRLTLAQVMEHPWLQNSALKL